MTKFCGSIWQLDFAMVLAIEFHSIPTAGITPAFFAGKPKIVKAGIHDSLMRHADAEDLGERAAIRALQGKWMKRFWQKDSL